VSRPKGQQFPHRCTAWANGREKSTGLRRTLSHLTVLASDAGRYGWIEEVLRHILADLQRFSGYRRAQVTQRVSRGVGPQTRVKRDRAPTHALVRCYTAADVALLAEVDCLKRESRDFGSRRDAPPALATVSATGTERQHR